MFQDIECDSFQKYSKHTNVNGTGFVGFHLWLLSTSYWNFFVQWIFIFIADFHNYQCHLLLQAYHDTDVGIWELGTTVATSCLFVMLFHVAIETRSWVS
jgi:hypothetical protein